MRPLYNAILYTSLGVLTLILGIVQQSWVHIVLSVLIIPLGIYWVKKAKESDQEGELLL